MNYASLQKRNLSAVGRKWLIGFAPLFVSSFLLMLSGCNRILLPNRVVLPDSPILIEGGEGYVSGSVWNPKTHNFVQIGNIPVEQLKGYTIGYYDWSAETGPTMLPLGP